MKFKNKFLASLLAVVLGLGVLGLPAFNLFETKAESATISTEVLEIFNVNKSYDVTQNSEIFFGDYCQNPNAEVNLYSPNGEILYPGNLSQGNESAIFRNPGLYALEFKLLSNGHYIYADPLYIPVSTTGVETITLDGKLNPKVKPGTTVVCPTPVNADWSVDGDVSVKVYTPYGESIGYNVDGNGKKSFTNKTDVLGKYFVEYTKQVNLGGYNQTFYKYETIEFSSDSSLTTSTVYFDKPTVTASEAKIVVSNTDISAEKEYIYLFKYYDIKNVYVQKADGSTDETAEIFVTIYDSSIEKYYNFTTGNFDILTSADAKVNIKSISEDFILRTADNLSSMSATGHTIKFSYTSTVDDKDLEQVVERKEKFNFDDITVSTIDLVQSEITNINIVNDATQVELGSMNLGKVQIIANGNYDMDALKAMVKTVRLTITPTEGGQEFHSTTAYEAGKVGIESVSSANELDKTFIYHYNRNATADNKTLRITYAVDFDSNGETDFNGSKTCSYNVHVRTERRDYEAPGAIQLGSYALVSTDGTYKIPTATATDKDDTATITTGAKVTATIQGPSYASPVGVTVGGELSGLLDGTYTLKFTATDYYGNYRVKTIKFRVEANRTNISPSLTIGSTNITQEGNKFSVQTTSNADYIVIYGGEDGQFSPTKVEYLGDQIKAFEFEVDTNYACVAVYAKSNTYSTVYGSIKILDGVPGKSVRSFGYDKINSGYTSVQANTTVEANVLDKLLWMGSNEMTIDAEEGAYYTICDDNVLTFYTAGTYTIKSNEQVEVNGNISGVQATTTIVIKNSYTRLKVTEPIGNKQVAKKYEAIADRFILNYPVVTNYYGYTLERIIKDSAGNIVTNAIHYVIDEYFAAPSNDEYTIEYVYRADGMNKTVHTVTVTTGNVATPKISLAGENVNKIWEGENIKYVIQNASAIDKNGKTVAVNVSCYDQYGRSLVVKAEGENKYVELTGAGFYTLYYTAIDESGLQTMVTSTFAVEFPEDDDNDGLSAWAVIGIVFASTAVACGIALLIIFIIKRKKAEKRFINKNRVNKKKEKREVIESTTLYTISESKDEKHWMVKNGNRTIAKVTSKAEAIEKAKENHKKGELSIKVYNKNGRLIDTI